MAMQILRDPSTSGRFIESLGTGLASGLQELAQNKLKEVENSKFWSSLGLPEDKARAFARAPESVQKSLLDRLEGINLGGNTSQQQAGQSGQFGQQQMNQAGQQQGGITLGANSAERRHRETIREQQLARASKENAEAFKSTAGYRDRLNNEAESYEGNLFRIKEAKELEKEGKLNSQGYLTFLNAAGLENVEGLINGDTAAYNKILADFQKGAKEVYGGRITNNELDQFLKTIPNLYMSPSGRSKIFSMMEYWNRGGIEKQKIMREIMKENNGVPPHDIQEQVIERSKSRLDKLAERFKSDLQESLTLAQKQQGSSKFGVGAAHAGGKLVKNLPKGLAGAGLGAYAGSQIGAAGGPIGALGGAALGGLAGLGGTSIKDFL